MTSSEATLGDLRDLVGEALGRALDGAVDAVGVVRLAGAVALSDVDAYDRRLCDRHISPFDRLILGIGVKVILALLLSDDTPEVRLTQHLVVRFVFPTRCGGSWGSTPPWAFSRYRCRMPGFSFDLPMGEALTEARLSLVDGDVPVGAVVLDPEGAIVGRGHNQREATHDPTAHAEILALREAASSSGTWRLDGHTLVVTLEPCVMCAGALLQARIQRLVIGAWDEKAGAAGSRWDLVRDGRIGSKVEVISGVREAECTALLTDFFKARRD